MNIRNKTVSLSYGGYQVLLGRFQVDLTVHSPIAILEVILEYRIDVFTYGIPDLVPLIQACISDATDSRVLLDYKKLVQESFTAQVSFLAGRERLNLVGLITARLQELLVVS